MADAEQDPVVADVDEDDEHNTNYVPPVQKALDEIVNTDADDESLQKYKQALLGNATSETIIKDPNNPSRVIMKEMVLVSPESPGRISMDLTKCKDDLKKETFTMKEGANYHIEVNFYVQREIVTGLRYHHTVTRKGIKVDKVSQMMGSYGPKVEMHTYKTPMEEAPKGMMMRGDYKVKSKVYDDDDNEYANWEWNLSIKKDW